MRGLRSSFIFSRLDHCQFRARDGSVGIVNFRLGQVNMVERSQQQRIDMPSKLVARLTADKRLMAYASLLRQRHRHIPELVSGVNSIDR